MARRRRSILGRRHCGCPGTGWKGGSFRAAVGRWLGRKVKRATVKAKKSLVKGAKSAIGIKRKK